MRIKKNTGKGIIAMLFASAFVLLFFPALSSSSENLIILSFDGGGGIVKTDKESYFLGETALILIQLSPQEIAPLSLQIVCPKNTYVMMSDSVNSTSFMPREIGIHYVNLLSSSGNVVSSAQFEVVNKKSYEFLDNASVISFPFEKKAEITAKNSRRENLRILSQNYNKIERRLSVSFDSLAVSQIDFNDIEESQRELRIEDVPSSEVDSFSGKAVRSFAIDPTSINFTSADVYFTATGDELWKCAEYDFYSRACTGRYIKIMDTVPGQQYIISLSPNDPLYTETLSNVSCSCQNTGPGGGTAYCEVFCAVNVPIPPNATEGYLSQVSLNVTIRTSISNPGVIVSGSGHHSGYFDRDQTKGNSNESEIGNTAYDGAGTTNSAWTNSSLASSGAYSFSKDNCANWNSGYCTWYIFLNSTAQSSRSNRAATTNITLRNITWTWDYIAAQGPSNISLNLTAPPNSNITNLRNVNFSYIPNSSSAISNCTLYLNLSGSWGAAAINTSVQNNSVNRINYSFSSDGVYLWNIRCFSGNNSNFGVSNRTITIDTAYPAVSLISPPDSNFSNESVVTFFYNVTDNFNIEVCSLIVDNSSVSSSFSVTKSVSQNITYSLSNGVHNWSINCTDEAGNTNSSSSRTINVSATFVIWDRRWYETSESSYTSTAGISLSNTRDSTENNVVVSVSPGSSYALVNALSPYIGSNGAFIPAGTNASFSSELSTSPGNKGLVSWYLYKTDGSTDTLLCNDGDGSSGGNTISATSTGLCTISSDTRLLPTERLKLVIIVYNSFGNTVAFTHTWDNLRLSYVELSTFITLGTLSISMVSPSSNLSISQNDIFNQSCNVTCSGGTCFSTNVSAQYNSSSSSWANIGGSGNLILNTGETNPHSIGSINSTNSTIFSIKGNAVSTTSIRCIAVSVYSNATDSITRSIFVSDSTAPAVSLGNPANFSWQNNATVVVYYTPSDNSALVNCSAYKNGILNHTDSPISNGVQQNFTFYGLSDALYNWTVNCTDDSGLSAQPSVKWFYVDKEKPSIELHLPADSGLETQSLIFFNFTATDNMDSNISCNLTIDNVIRRSYINASNATPEIANYTLSLGMHYWNITCADNASNYNTSATRSFNVTDTPPDVSLVFPDNNYWERTGNITFRFNSSDNNILVNCSLIINGALNQSKNSSELINGGENNFTIPNMVSGQYLWAVNCTDDGAHITSEGPRTLNIDKSIPYVQIVSPSDFYNSSASSVSLQFRAVDFNSPNLSCNLTIDNAINESGIFAQNNSAVSRSVSFFDGMHLWNVSCSDLGGNYNMSETRNLNVSSIPAVSLSSPASNSWSNGITTFVFTASDNDGLFNCSLMINGAVNATKNSSQLLNGGSNNFTVSDLSEGTNQQWAVRCFDSGTYKNSYTTAGRNFHVDRHAPTINLTFPHAEEQVNYTNISFNFTATDNFASALSCNLSINGVINQSGISVQSGQANEVNVSGFIDAIYYWNVTCRDTAYNIYWSGTRWFNVSVPPEVNLYSPSNNQWSNSQNIILYYYTYDSSGIAGCSLVINGAVNDTSTSVLNGNYSNFTVNFPSEGKYNWSVNCTDTAGIRGYSSTWNITIDRTSPWILLNSPDINSNLTSNYVTFNWTASDSMAAFLNCTLYVEENIKETGINSTNNTAINKTYIYGDGNYSWNVSCLDQAMNINWSETRNFSIIAPPNVTLENPGNNYWGTSQDLTFTYIPIDPIGIRQCNLYIDGALNATENSINANVENSFTVNSISEGAHTWTVNCTDSDWNTYAPPELNFYVDLSAPLIEINSPDELSIFNISRVLFNFTATDSLSQNMSCNITINNAVNQSIVVQNNSAYNFTLSGMSDNIYYWNVSCTDLSGNQNTSASREFTVRVKPDVFLVSPPNASWSGLSGITFHFNATDNDGLSNCTLIINGNANATKSTGLVNGGESNITSAFSEGEFVWGINCTDSGVFKNVRFSSAWKLFVDLSAPEVYLYEPGKGSSALNNSLVFNFSASDAMSEQIYCNLSIDNIVNISAVEISNNSNYLASVYNLTSGRHYWNVTCWDYVNHSSTSETWNFTIPKPDLTLNSSDIMFYYNTTNPEEGKAVTINATIYNLGASSADNFIVQFFDGDPSLSGVQIGQNQTLSLSPASNSTLSANWTASLGAHNVFVIVDPPLSSNGSILEENESNNYANRTLLIQSWHYIFGNLSGEFGLGSMLSDYLFLWNLSDANGSNIFAADSDSSINWSSLAALGISAGGSPSPNDFSEIDSALSMSSFSDSVNSTFTSGGNPIKEEIFLIYGRSITDVAVANSTDNENFETGILWDSSDGNTEYNGTQDVIFVTRANTGASGKYGIYDYELRVPSNLKGYKGSTPSVSLYIEIK
jgi:hypothetical protein